MTNRNYWEPARMCLCLCVTIELELGDNFHNFYPAFNLCYYLAAFDM